MVESGPLPLITEPWRAWAVDINGVVTNLNQIPGVNRLTMAQLNALGLGAADDGYIAWESTYGHALRWNGAAWSFAPGDCGNGFWVPRAFAPQEVGWQLMDGTVTDYLSVGTATLTAAPFTTPNVTSGTFLKAVAAYTGLIDAAIAAALSGSTGNTTPTISGNTGNTTPTIAGDTGTQVGTSGNVVVQSGTGNTVVNGNHTHDKGSLAVSSHLHDNGTLAVSSHLHAAGTLATDTAARPPSLGGLLYFRR
jgi:hypothetical protein